MHRYVLLLVACLLGMGVSLSAQKNVGFFGKKMSVGYTLGYHGSATGLVSVFTGEKIDGARYYNSALDGDRVPFFKAVFQFEHSLSLTYGIGSNFDISAFYAAQRDGFDELFINNIKFF